MNIALFNRKYWVRRFGEQRVVRGFVTNDHTDFVASLHVHPSGSDQQQQLPEGERRLKRLEGHASIELRVGNEQTHTKGDLLYYHGEWYECVSAQFFDHTLLSHLNYQFVLVPTDGAHSTDLQDPPTVDPETYVPDAEKDGDDT